MRIAALACVFALASAGCTQGQIAASDGGASRDAAALSPSTGAGDSSEGGAPTQPQTDAAPGAIGDPCIPDMEKQATFGGFVEEEISTSSNTPQCGATDVCLVNHFRGRVTCPYGEDSQGRGPDGSAGCRVAGGSESVPPEQEFPYEDAGIEPQCVDRTAARAVYCSCRCANAAGGTDDRTYCTCPGGMTCTQLLASLGPPLPGETDISGAYCVKAGTLWDGGRCGTSCDPSSAPCP